MRVGLTLLVRPSIGKALADDARVVAEVELGKVAMQVLFLAMLVDAAQPGKSAEATPEVAVCF